MQEKINLPVILQTNYIYIYTFINSAIGKSSVRICLKKTKTRKTDTIFREEKWLGRKSLLTDVT